MPEDSDYITFIKDNKLVHLGANVTVGNEQWKVLVGFKFSKYDLVHNQCNASLFQESIVRLIEEYDDAVIFFPQIDSYQIIKASEKVLVKFWVNNDTIDDLINEGIRELQNPVLTDMPGERNRKKN